MKILLSIPILLFVTLFITGYMAGQKEVKKKNYIEEYVFKHTYLKVSEKQADLFIDVGNGNVFSYDVDTNKLKNIPLEAFMSESDIDNPDIKIFNLDGQFVSSLMGGATIGFKIKDLYSKLKLLQYADPRRSAVKIFISAISMISGYGAGYWFSTQYAHPDIDDKISLDIISNKNNWAKHEFFIFRNILFSFAWREKVIEEIDFKETKIWKKGLSYINKLNSKDLTSNDFIFLSSISNGVKPEDSIRELREDKRIDERRELTIWFLSIFVLGTIIFVIYIYIKDKRL